MSRNSAIVLIGASGSGKTTVGRILSDKLGRPFVDTDSIIEKRAGRTIAEIFAAEGEEAFRKLESEAVVEAASFADAVISCGGGAVLDPSNVEILKSSGSIVYLKVSPEVAASRLGENPNRPLLNGDVATLISELIRARSEIYEETADYTVDADLDATDVSAEIRALLSRREQ